jgi:hypothetical protein
MSDDKFKLPLSSYEELVKFIKAYSHITDPTGLNDVSRMTGVGIQNISKNVGFLVATGILEGGKMKMPTPVGKQLGHALEHNIPSEICKSWRRIIEEDEFLTKLLTSIRIRNGMDSQTLEAHIAYSAGQPKKSQIMTGARTIIDILKSAELIIEVDGKYLTKEPFNASESHTNINISQNILEKPQKPQENQRLSFEKQDVQINIKININCTPENIQGLGINIKKMIHEINEIENNNKDGEE